MNTDTLEDTALHLQPQQRAELAHKSDPIYVVGLVNNC